MGGQSERTQCQAKMAALNLFRYICTRAFNAFRSFAHCRAASTVIPLLPSHRSLHTVLTMLNLTCCFLLFDNTEQIWKRGAVKPTVFLYPIHLFRVSRLSDHCRQVLCVAVAAPHPQSCVGSLSAGVMHGCYSATSSVVRRIIVDRCYEWLLQRHILSRV